MTMDNGGEDSAKSYHDSQLRDAFSMVSKGQTLNILPLLESELQYRDGFAEQLAYWKQQLEGAGTILELPIDRLRSPNQTYAGERYSFVFPQSLTAALKNLSQREEVSLFVTLLAAFQILLYRYTGQDDLLIGTPCVGRSELTNGMSEFVNLIILRARMTGNPSFRELLGRVREVVLEAYANSDVPFEKVMANLQLEPDRSRHPLCQVIFALEENPQDGHEFMNMGVDERTAKPDLTLFVQGLGGWMEYNTNLFDAATIERLIGHWQTLLEGIVANPAQRIADFPLLSKEEWHQQVVEWNATQTAYPQNQCLHELFEEQVERTPEAVAIVCEQEQLTYRELNQRANQLAHSLQSLGVMPETSVALLIERSIDFIAAILAVFKAGGAFLPLDPQFPARRHYEILRQSKCHYVLTADQFGRALAEALEEFDAGQRPQVIHIERIFQKEEAKENLPNRSKPGNLAYIMYTSGSTGVPKGVMVEQAGMVNHIYAKITDLGISMEDRVAQNSPPCFDIVVWQCLAALVVGGRVHIFKDEIALDPLQLLQETDKQKITILEVVPSVLRAMVREAEMLGEARPGLKDLRWMVPTGDALSPELCRQWLKLYPAIPMLNNCGSTECSDDNCHYAIYQSPPVDYPLVIMPIGRPIQHIRAYILDQQLKPVPIGVVGDLYIGGIGVGRGYLHDVERTARIFLPDPFSTEPGARLYKTGDLARYLPDGTIMFLGRKDHMVKIRGNRIELAEIEAVLARHPEVKESVVVVGEDEIGEKHLAAYIVRDVQPSPIETQIQGSELEASTAEQWEAIFDEVYSQEPTSPQDEKINLKVWESSYRNQPFPEVEIFESVNDSVERILSLHPKRVLEIGCGTGLLLFPIAPHTTYYCGTEISQRALEKLQHRVEADAQELSEVVLLHCAADDFTSIPKKAFDVVIINEVVQYFPSIYYLLRTLEGALARVQPGGYIFVGGVRNLRLLEAYHLGVQLPQTSPSSPIGELHQRVLHLMGQEKELVIDPDFFLALKQHFPRISDVQILLKGGKHRNELTQFRYDAIIRVGAEEPAATDYPCLSWQEQKVNLADLQQLLLETKPEVLGVIQIPNERILSEIKTLELLANFEQVATVDELQKASQEALSDICGVDPEQLQDLGRSLSYDVDICWSASGTKEYFDVVFKRCGTETQPRNMAFIWARKDIPVRPWSQYANSPAHNISSADLVAQLRAMIKEKLPDYMMPSAFVLLEALPRTANGKLDRRALPAPDQTRTELQSIFVAPRTPLEAAIAAVWSQVLQIEQVGIHDNFFALGGHSLLAMQVLSRLRASLQVVVPLHGFLEAPTVAQLAELLQQYQASNAKSPRPAIRSISREAYRVPWAKGSTN